MRKIFTVLFLLLFAFSLFGANSKIVGPMKKLPAVAPKDVAKILENKTISEARPNAKMGPGTFLMESSYDFNTNSCVPRNIFNHGDGTLQLARMEETSVEANDRSTYWSYFDGSAWLLPLTRVEGVRSGWGNISAMTDGRAVISTHNGIQVNVDALAGFGLWTSFNTGEWPDPAQSDLTWPRTSTDGSDVIHMVVCHSAYVPFPDVGAQIPAYMRSVDGGMSWEAMWLFQPDGAAPTDRPDTTDGLWIGGGDADAYAIDTWNNKVGIAAFAYYTTTPDGGFRGQEVMLAESEDNGQTFTFTNITQAGTDVNPDGDYRPCEHIDIVYDGAGEPHVIYTTWLALPDSLGENMLMYGSTDAPLMHWSPSTGLTEVCRRTCIPELGGVDTNFVSSDTWGRGLGSGVYWISLGRDANDNLYATFNAPCAGVDADTVSYLDVYASASTDGGATWGCPPVNVTNSPDTEDKYASLARLVDDNLHIVYHSDDVNGGAIQPGNQTTPTNLLYLIFPAADVPTENTCPGTKVEKVSRDIIPSGYSLAQNYPNPFNPSTEIWFEIPTSAKVSLKVYNMMGQVVATLVDENLSAGRYNFTWNTTHDLTSGVYMYRLETPEFSSSKKLILMK